MDVRSLSPPQPYLPCCSIVSHMTAMGDFYISLPSSSMAACTILVLFLFIVFWCFKTEEDRKVLPFYFSLRWDCYAREGSTLMQKYFWEAGPLKIQPLHWKPSVEPTGRACLIYKRSQLVYNIQSHDLQKTPKYRSLTGESQRRSFYPSKIAAVGFLNHLESDWISCLPLWSDKKSCKLLLPEIFGLNPLVPVPPVAAPQKHTFLRVPFGFQSTFSADSKLKICSSLIETVRW